MLFLLLLLLFRVVSSQIPTSIPDTTTNTAQTNVSLSALELQEQAEMEAAEPLSAALTASTTATLAASFLAGGGGPALELQTLAVLGTMRCAGPRTRGASKGGMKAVVLPITFFPGRAGKIFSLASIFFAAVLLHGAITFAFQVAKQLSFVEASNKLGFPSRSLAVICLIYQGVAYESWKTLTEDAAIQDTVISSTALLFCAVLPLVPLWLLKTNSWTVRYGRFRHAFHTTPKIVQHVLMPSGWWRQYEEPGEHTTILDSESDTGVSQNKSKEKEVLAKKFLHRAASGDRKVVSERKLFIVSRFGSLFKSINGNSCLWFTPLLFGKVFLVSFVVNAKGISCPVAFATLAVLHFVFGLLVILWRPFRHPVENFSGLIVNGITGLVALFNWKWKDSRTPSYLVACAGTLSLISLLSLLLLQFFELRWIRNEMSLRNGGKNVLLISSPLLDAPDHTSTGESNDDELLEDEASVCDPRTSAMSKALVNPLMQSRETKFKYDPFQHGRMVPPNNRHQQYESDGSV